MKKHVGSGKPQGALNRGTRQQPSPLHGGTSLRKDVVHAPQPRGYGVHGGTDLRMGVLNKKRK
jgi:hypothetical protein